MAATLSYWTKISFFLLPRPTKLGSFPPLSLFLYIFFKALKPRGYLLSQSWKEEGQLLADKAKEEAAAPGSCR